jgi:hypothetical protein
MPPPLIAFGSVPCYLPRHLLLDPIRIGLPALWPAVLEIIDRSCTLGHIRS